MQTYLDASAKNALDALVSRLEGAVTSAADRAMTRPLEDLRQRLSGLGEREAAVLERLDLILTATGAQAVKLDETGRQLGSALEQAAERTVSDLAREVQSGLERVSPSHLLEVWGARLEEAVKTVGAARSAELAAVDRRVEALASAVDGLGRRLDERPAQGDGREEMSQLAGRLEAMQRDAQRVLEGQAADRETAARLHDALPHVVSAAVGSTLAESGRAAWREDLNVAADRVAAELDRTLAPRAGVIDDRLKAVSEACDRSAVGLDSLTAAQHKVHTILGALTSELPSRLADELRTLIAPLHTRADEQQGAVRTLQAALDEARTSMMRQAENEPATMEQMSSVARSVEALGSRLTFIQDGLQTRELFTNRAAPLVKVCIGLVLVNLAATLLLVTAAAVRHLLW